MREIISLQVGQCGNQLGTAFWSNICQEHQIGFDGKFCGVTGSSSLLERSEVYFSEAQNGKFVPRSVLVDLEPAVVDKARGGELGCLFRPDNMISGQNGAGNNWAKGHYTEGAELVEETMDVIRREAEACDVLQGFQISHSLGGGTGSGMGTLLMSKIKEEFPDRMTCSFSVFPSNESDVVVQPYNCLLSLSQLIEVADSVVCFDNQALYDICTRNLKLSTPDFSVINSLVSNVMSGITCPFRFPGQLNSDLRKLCVNLVPFPRLHFFMPSYAPMTSSASKDYLSVNIHNLNEQLTNPHNLMVAADPRLGHFFCGSAIYRGAGISMKEVDYGLHALQDKLSSYFVPWIPNSLQASVCNVSPPGTEISATFLTNSTACNSLFSRNLEEFSSMFRRKAFLFWFTSEGMDEMEFTEAESNVSDLLSELDCNHEAVSDEESCYESNTEADFTDCGLEFDSF